MFSFTVGNFLGRHFATRILYLQSVKNKLTSFHKLYLPKAKNYSQLHLKHHQSVLFKGYLFMKNGPNFKFFVLCSKCVLRYGAFTHQIFRELAALEPLQNGGQRGVRRSTKFDFYTYFLMQNHQCTKGYCI